DCLCVSLTRSILSFSVDIIAPPVFLVDFIVSQCITHCQSWIKRKRPHQPIRCEPNSIQNQFS
ncbi:hypothetical protein, partial [Acetivibrio straminisolvens]|uniref:hypothetical protein n=1 Tax=Acetivibrio straminisolvens TaxID=253314 RepID=UPI002352E594